MVIPDILEFRKVRRREHLRLGMFGLEAPLFGRRELRLRIGILAACALIEPACLARGALLRRRPDPPGKPFHPHMERVVREEVGGIHPILGVRILRYPWNDRLALQAVNDGQLQLDEYLGKIGPVPFPCVEQRCSGLATIDDLEVDNPRDRQTGIRHPCLDTLCSGRDPVVVGKEHPRFVQDRCPDSLVHIAAGL